MTVVALLQSSNQYDDDTDRVKQSLTEYGKGWQEINADEVKLLRNHWHGQYNENGMVNVLVEIIEPAETRIAIDKIIEKVRVEKELREKRAEDNRRKAAEAVEKKKQDQINNIKKNKEAVINKAMAVYSITYEIAEKMWDDGTLKK